MVHMQDTIVDVDVRTALKQLRHIGEKKEKRIIRVDVIGSMTGSEPVGLGSNPGCGTYVSCPRPYHAKYKVRKAVKGNT